MNNFDRQLNETISNNYDRTITLGKLSGALYIEQKFLEAKPKTVEGAYQVIAKARAEFDKLQGESIQQTIDDARARIDGMTSRQYEADAKADHRTDI